MTGEGGRVCATTDVEGFAGGMEPFDFPDGFDFSRQGEWRIVDGELVHDPPPEPDGLRRARLASFLAETDYVVVKMAEASLAGYELPEADAERYRGVIARRRAARAEVSSIDDGEGAADGADR